MDKMIHCFDVARPNGKPTTGQAQKCRDWKLKLGHGKQAMCCNQNVIGNIYL